MRADGLLLLSEEVESAIRQVLCADLQPLREQSTSLSIEQEDAVNLPYSTFFSQFLVPNRPVLVRGLCTEWPAMRDWVKVGEGAELHQINLEYFQECFGEAVLNVAECGVRDFSDQRRRQMTMKEYVDYWRRHRALREARERGKRLEGPFMTDEEIAEAELILYNKDWHYVKQNPDKIAYTLPLIFSDDWLNLHWDTQTDVDDDYRFVYMGPKGSWTPLHSGLVIFFSRKIALTQQSVLTRMSRRLWILQLECQRVWEKEVDLLPP